jgi:hypothetical protein
MVAFFKYATKFSYRKLKERACWLHGADLAAIARYPVPVFCPRRDEHGLAVLAVARLVLLAAARAVERLHILALSKSVYSRS